MPGSATEVRRGASDVGVVAASFAASRALFFLAVVVLARTLSTDDFAAYVVILAIWTFLVPVLDCGLAQIVTRAASSAPGARSFRFTGEALRARGPLWAAAAGIAGVGSVAGLWPNSALYLLSVVAAIGQAQLDTASGELIGRRRFAAGSLLRISPGALGLAGALCLSALGASTTSAMAVFAAARLLPTLAIQLFVPLAPGPGGVSWREGVPFALTNGLGLLYTSSDVILLSAFGTAAATIAVYGVAYRTLLGLASVIPGAIALAVYPRVVTRLRPAARDLTRTALGVSVGACTLVLAVLFLDLKEVFALFGPTFSDGIETVRPLLLVLVPVAASSVCLAALQARFSERVALTLVAVVAVVNLAGNAALIPAIGVRGALVATSTAEWIAAFGTLWLLRSRLGLPGRDAFVLGILLVPAVLSFLDVSGPLVSAALLAWLVGAWILNGLDLRASVSRLVREGRVSGGSAGKDGPELAAERGR